jgi:hypothetical protein
LHGKALTGFLLLVLVLVVVGSGCGGGTPSSTSVSTLPVQVRKKFLERVKGRKEEQRASRTQSKEGQSGSQSKEAFRAVEHYDSGGGSAQFRVRGGDNSIQEFGEEASASMREEAAEALHGFLDARAAGDYAKACSYLSAAATRGFAAPLAKKQGKEAPMGCSSILARLSRSVSHSVLIDAAEADVGSLRTDGKRGFLLYHGSRHANYAMPMVFSGGRWKVAAIEGSELY